MYRRTEGPLLRHYCCCDPLLEQERADEELNIVCDGKILEKVEMRYMRRMVGKNRRDRIRNERTREEV